MHTSTSTCSIVLWFSQSSCRKWSRGVMIWSWGEFIKLSEATMLIGPLSGWPAPGSPPAGGLPRRRMFWDDCVAAATNESCSCTCVKKISGRECTGHNCITFTLSLITMQGYTWIQQATKITCIRACIHVACTCVHTCICTMYNTCSMHTYFQVSLVNWELWDELLVVRFSPRRGRCGLLWSWCHH